MSMMDDVWTNAKAAVDVVGKKAGQVIDKSKLRFAVMDIKAELSKKYRMLGKIYYEANRTGKNYDDSMKALQESITELHKQLAALKEMMANAENKIKCPACGVYNAKDSLFCSKCGARLSVKKQDEEYSQEELLDFAEEIMDEDDI